MASLLRAGRALRVSTSLRAGARRMCTAAVEGATEAPVGPFSPTIPHNAQYYTAIGIGYLFVLRWQSKDRSLKKEIDEHNAAKAAEAAAAAPVVEAVAEPEAAAPSAVVVAVTTPAAPATAAPGSGVTMWKVGDVVAWLDAVELGQHAEAFKTHSINGKMLLTLNDQDLYGALEIKSPLHRKKLLMEISQLRKEYLSK